MKNWEKCCPCFASFAFSSSSPSSPDPFVRRRRRAARRRFFLRFTAAAAAAALLHMQIYSEEITSRKTSCQLQAKACSMQPASQSYYCNSRQFCIFILLVFVYTEGILVHQKYLVNNTLLLSVIYQTFKKDFSVKISENYYHRVFYIDPKISL